MSKQYNYFTSSIADTRESNKFSPISRKCTIIGSEFIPRQWNDKLKRRQRNSADDRLKNPVTNNAGDLAVGYAIAVKYRKTLRETAACLLRSMRDESSRKALEVSLIHVFPTTSLIVGISVFLPARLVRDAD